MVRPLERMEKEKQACWVRPLEVMGSLLDLLKVQVLCGDIIRSLKIQVCSLRKRPGLEIQM